MRFKHEFLGCPGRIRAFRYRPAYHDVVRSGECRHARRNHDMLIVGI
jgi:hypothetical protein